jgi:long-subunit acyl-CoA synthetase (AMP-forming)
MTRVYHSPYPPLNVPTDQSVSQFLLRCNPDDVTDSKVILEDFDSHSEPLTYGSIRTNASKCAYSLRHKLGLKVGETLCIVAKNSVNYALLAHAVMWAGGCFRYDPCFATSNMSDTLRCVATL